MLCDLQKNFNALKSKDHKEVRNAIEKLSETNDIRAVEAILSTLGWKFDGDSECKINFTASIALKKMGEAALQPTIDALKEDPTYSHDDSWRRYWVARSLGIRKDGRVVEPLLKVLQSESDKRILEGVVDALGSIAWQDNFGGYRQSIVKALMSIREQYDTDKGYLINSIDKLLKRLDS